jgi:hypothetical protein
VSAECARFEWRGWKRKEAVDALDEIFDAPGCDAELAEAFRKIRMLRNALAHGNPPTEERFRKLLASPEKLREALQSAVDHLLPLGGRR